MLGGNLGNIITIYFFMQPMQNRFFINPAQQFHDNDLLHLKPFSHRIYKQTTSFGTWIQQRSCPSARFHHLNVGAAKGLTAVGYVLNTVVALIESFVAFVFSALALSLHAATRARSQQFQKIALKICAYWIHTVMVAGVQIFCLKKRFFSNNNSLNAVGNHSLHGVAALTSQFIGYGFDRWTGRNPVNPEYLSPATRRAIQIIIEIAPLALAEISQGAVKDFAAYVRHNEHNPEQLLFLRRHPNYAEILNRFNLEDVRNNPAYRRQLLQLLIGNDFVGPEIFNRVVENFEAAHILAQGQAEERINLFGANQHAQDKAYQNHLKDLIKNSFVELHDNKHLIEMIGGRENLLTYSTLTELVYYVQLQEIKNVIVCPQEFGANELRPYNNRQFLLEKAKAQFLELNEKEQQILLEKLLRTGAFDLEIQNLPIERIKCIQQLFNDIASLAMELYKGKLLRQEWLDVRQLNQGAFHKAVGEIDFFKKACQEAVEKIEAR